LTWHTDPNRAAIVDLQRGECGDGRVDHLPATLDTRLDLMTAEHSPFGPDGDG
jgi:hypothetical protein